MINVGHKPASCDSATESATRLAERKARDLAALVLKAPAQVSSQGQGVPNEACTTVHGNRAIVHKDPTEAGDRFSEASHYSKGLGVRSLWMLVLSMIRIELPERRTLKT